MAREQRTDVDYFPHECTHGRKMHIIQKKYGNNGYAVWFKLLEELGKAKNHYIDISDDTTLMFLSAIFDVDENMAIDILDDLAKLGAIDKYLFDKHRVIWSEKFKNSIEDAYKKRKMKIFQSSDILDEIRAKSGQSSGGLTGNQAKSGQKVVNPPEVIPKEKNSIEKNSKEEKSIEEKIKENYEDRKLKFSSTLQPYLKIYGKDLLNEFYKYWTEPNKSKTKFRQELEKAWDLERRLITWEKNDKKFKKFENGKSNSESGVHRRDRNR